MHVNTTMEHESPLHLQFDDNRLLPHLYGKQDEHLSKIEEKLSVSVTSRGNRLAIEGPPERIRMARAALELLYRRLQKGLDVDTGEVEAAVRLAMSMEGTLLDPETYTIPTRTRLISPRSAGQVHYIQALQESELVIALGPAGSGKTYLAVAMAVSMLITGQVDRIILSRPAVEAGERLGFLPGDLREKIDPYLRPLYEALHDMMPLEQVNRRLASGEIEIAPLAFMRGRTLSNAFVILDEAQNTTTVQMKMLLTRLGENARMAVTGDLTQVDLPKGVCSGLRDSLEILMAIDGVCIVELSDADVVRHSLVSDIVRAYDTRDRKADVSTTDLDNEPNNG